MLRLLSGVQGVPEIILIACEGITIGRNGATGVGAHVCLQHPNCPGLLSRQHASIRLGPKGNLILRDLGSMNGTFVCPGLAQPAHRLPANEDALLCPGSILYFGGKEQVFGKDGQACPNPFIYQFVSRHLAPPDMKARVDQQVAAVSTQPGSAAAEQPPQQQTVQLLQQSQHVEAQPPQLSAHNQWRQLGHAINVDKPAPKRQKLPNTAAMAGAQQEACEAQQHQAPQEHIMQQLPAAAEHSPSGSSISVELLEDEAAAAGCRHHQQPQQQQCHVGEPGVIAGSEPEVLQQLRYPLQEAAEQTQHHDQVQPALQPQQQQRQPCMVAQQSAARDQQSLSGQDAGPLAELNHNVPLHQQHTPASNKKAGTTAAGKAAAAARHSPLSPGMRVSASTLECAICKEVMVAPHTLGCGHTFCGPCLQLWLERHKPTCPTCRTPVTQAPVLQLILNSLVSEAALNQGSEAQDRAARLDAWNAVKDVTLAHWAKRFNNSSNSKQAKQPSRAPRQHGPAAAAAAGERPATRQQQQQTRQAPAGVVSLLPSRPSHRAPAAGAATIRQANQATGRHTTRVAAALAAVRASQAAAAAAAAAVINRAAGRNGSRRRTARRRGVTVSAGAATSSTRRGNNPLATHAVAQQHQDRVPARQQQMQEMQQLQWPQQQQARPRAARQAPIDSFLRRGVSVVGQ